MDIKSLKNLLTAVAVAYASVFALLLAANCLSIGAVDPEKYLPVFAYIAFFGGAFVSGLLASRFNADSRIPSALIAGAIYLALIFLISLFFYGEKPAGERALLNLIGLSSSAVGGLTGGFRRPKRILPQKSRDYIRRRYLNK